MRLYRTQAGAGTPGAWRLGRPVSIPQAHYWRRIDAELHAATARTPAGATSTTWNVPPLAPGGLNGVTAASVTTASIGPEAVGERWTVDLVQVHTASQYGQGPLVTQQAIAQATGASTVPPPPVVAQVWLAVAGVNVHLLGQTTQGGNDNLGVACPPLAAGERISVTWYGMAAGDVAWAVLRGTRHVLSAT